MARTKTLPRKATSLEESVASSSRAISTNTKGRRGHGKTINPKHISRMYKRKVRLPSPTNATVKGKTFTVRFKQSGLRRKRKTMTKRKGQRGGNLFDKLFGKVVQPITGGIAKTIGNAANNLFGSLNL